MGEGEESVHRSPNTRRVGTALQTQAHGAPRLHSLGDCMAEVGTLSSVVQLMSLLC